jgi:hypothetical protein
MGIYERPRHLFIKHSKRILVSPRRNIPVYDTVESIKAMHNGKAKIFFCAWRQFSFRHSRTWYTAEALRTAGSPCMCLPRLNRSQPGAWR